VSFFTEGPRRLRLRPARLAFFVWLIGWPIAILVFKATANPCGPSGGSKCTGMDEYYPTVILMVLVWFAGVILAGGVWLSRRI
jgi:hypothetical protein